MFRERWVILLKLFYGKLEIDQFDYGGMKVNVDYEKHSRFSQYYFAPRNHDKMSGRYWVTTTGNNPGVEYLSWLM